MSVSLAEVLTPERLQELSTLFPVRCYTCRKTLANKQLAYEDLIMQGVRPGEAMTRLGITRQCCRMNAMSPSVLPLGLQVQQNPIPTESVPMLQLRQELAQLQIASEDTRELSGVLSIMQSAPTGVIAGPVIGKREFKTGPGTVYAPRIYRTQLVKSSALPSSFGQGEATQTSAPSIDVNEFLRALQEVEGPPGPSPASPRLPLSALATPRLPPPLPPRLPVSSLPGTGGPGTGGPGAQLPGAQLPGLPPRLPVPRLPPSLPLAPR